MSGEAMQDGRAQGKAGCEDFEHHAATLVLVWVTDIRCEEIRGTNPDFGKSPKKQTTQQGTVMYKSKFKHRKLQAFTLLEIMLVVMIIALLAAAAIHAFGPGSIITTKIAVTRANLQHAKTGLLQYQILAGRMPTTEQGLDALVRRPERDPKPRSWQQQSEKPVLDGFDQPFVYRNPGTRNPSGIDLYSVGPDGQAETPDDIWE
jgi:general secretion pathway protein G